MEIIEIKNLSKKFMIGSGTRTSLFKNVLTALRGEVAEKTFWCLKNINFSVKKGEMFGIVGPNGSGKTTLLKIMTGILKPTEGEIKINGRINFFLQLGIGFQPELSARENVYLYGAFLGLTRSEMNKKFKTIIDFAELNEFVDTKLRSYSAGMCSRLAFATAIQAESDILLLDEILAVGDLAFQKKCFEMIHKFKREGRTIIFVSHSLDMVEEFCESSLFLDKGEPVALGNTKTVVSKYKSMI